MCLCVYVWYEWWWCLGFVWVFTFWAVPVRFVFLWPALDFVYASQPLKWPLCVFNASSCPRTATTIDVSLSLSSVCLFISFFSFFCTASIQITTLFLSFFFVFFFFVKCYAWKPILTHISNRIVTKQDEINATPYWKYKYKRKTGYMFAIDISSDVYIHECICAAFIIEFVVVFSLSCRRCCRRRRHCHYYCCCLPACSPACLSQLNFSWTFFGFFFWFLYFGFYILCKCFFLFTLLFDWFFIYLFLRHNLLQWYVRCFYLHQHNSLKKNYK